MKSKKSIATLILLCLGMWACIAAGTSPRAREWFDRLAYNNNKMNEHLSVQLIEGADNNTAQEVHAEPDTQESLPPFPSEVEIPSNPAPAESPELVILPTTIEGGMVISNDTSYDIDLNKLVAEGTGVKLPKDGVQVLIIHTHGSEAYTPTGENNYDSSDNFRTEDPEYSVVKVGDELTACLESYGLSVIHDREIYDYPSYTGSYPRSGASVQKHLEEHPEIAIVLDVHRDAIGGNDVVYKTLAEGNGKPCSQLMLLAGTEDNGLAHPNWQENLKLALYMQSAIVNNYPTLARPIALSKFRYNQQLTTGSLILEVGSSGNTLEEALCAVRLFANAVGPALVDLIED